MESAVSTKKQYSSMSQFKHVAAGNRPYCVIALLRRLSVVCGRRSCGRRCSCRSRRDSRSSHMMRRRSSSSSVCISLQLLQLLVQLATSILLMYCLLYLECGCTLQTRRYTALFSALTHMFSLQVLRKNIYTEQKHLKPPKSTSRNHKAHVLQALKETTCRSLNSDSPSISRVVLAAAGFMVQG